MSDMTAEERASDALGWFFHTPRDSEEEQMFGDVVAAIRQAEAAGRRDGEEEGFSRGYEAAVMAGDADRVEALEARLGEVVRRCNTLESNSYTGRLEAENARLTDVAAQAHTLFDLCWNAIQTAIAHEDGLDGAVGETLMAEIREWQARNGEAIRALAESEKP